MKAAKDGANIVIAAKTAEPHPKLPGTIYSAAKEGKIIYLEVLGAASVFLLTLQMLCFFFPSYHIEVLPLCHRYLDLMKISKSVSPY